LRDKDRAKSLRSLADIVVKAANHVQLSGAGTSLSYVIADRRHHEGVRAVRPAHHDFIPPGLVQQRPRHGGIDADISLLRIEFVGADDAVAEQVAVGILELDPGAEEYFRRICGRPVDDDQLVQSLGEIAEPGVDLS
jgi:hypothetical protein